MSVFGDLRAAGCGTGLYFKTESMFGSAPYCRLTWVSNAPRHGRNRVQLPFNGTGHSTCVFIQSEAQYRLGLPFVQIAFRATPKGEVQPLDRLQRHRIIGVVAFN